MAGARAAKSPPGATGPTRDGEAAKKPEGTPTEFPLGISLTLPAGDPEGTLVPEVALVFDRGPDEVARSLVNPWSLAVSWAIQGKVANLRDVTLPCRLSWQVEYDDKARPPRTTDAIGKSAAVKIDGTGRFQVLVDEKNPVLDFVSAGVIGRGLIGFVVTLNQPAGAKPQPSTDKVKFDVGCEVSVTTDPPADPALGDKANYAFHLHEVFKKTKTTLWVVEQDSADASAGADKDAWMREIVPGKPSQVHWTIGYKDDSGSFGGRFAYSEEFEQGDFEFGWELRAQSPSLPADHKPFVILSSKEPLKVKKPQLQKFNVAAVDWPKGIWRAMGSIAGFSPKGPRVRLMVKLVDREGKHYPADLKQAPRVALEKDGSFSVEIPGPKFQPPPPGEPLPANVFAILSLLPTWQSDEKQDPISGFLGYDKLKFALYEETRRTGWNLSAAWLCSEESLGVAPRPPEPRKGGGGFTAPPPSAGDPQDSALTTEEIVADLVASEGYVTHMYLDSEGLVTVGIGTCLLEGKKEVAKDRMKPDKAVALPFLHAGTDRKADEEDKKTAYLNVAKMEKGRSADQYLTSPRLELDHATIVKLVKDYSDKAIDYLRKQLPGFDTFPKAARRAILDLVYNRGPGHFGPEKNYKIRQAALARDWAWAAREVPKDGQATRRQWRIDCFTYAQAFEESRKERTS